MGMVLTVLNSHQCTFQTLPGQAGRLEYYLDLLFSTIVLPGSGAIIGAVIGLVAVMTWRVREARGAVSIKKIVIPPLGMATGFCMFFVPAFRVPFTWGGIAFLIGAVALAYPLLLTSPLG